MSDDHWHVWVVAEDASGRRRTAMRKGRFGTPQAASQWGKRHGGMFWWVRKCDWPDECESRPVKRRRS